MAEYTYEQLRDKTVADLREIAQGIGGDALEGFSTMHKDHLLPLLCKVLNIPTHHAAAGAEKTQLKAKIRQLRTQRDQIMQSGDKSQLPSICHQIHAMKRHLRRMVVGAD
jgi:hypothetical protein